MVGRQVIHLVEFLQTNAILLRNRVHRFALADIVQPTLVVLRRLALLLLQPDNLALFQLVLAIALVIARQLAVADSNLLTDRLERIATTGYHIIILIEHLDGMERCAANALILGALSHEAVVALGSVKLVELVQLDDLNQLLGIDWACGIASSL